MDISTKSKQIAADTAELLAKAAYYQYITGEQSSKLSLERAINAHKLLNFKPLNY